MQDIKPIISRHSSWLVINSVQGCPNQCKYCFLKKSNLTGCKPKVLCSPQEAIKLLLNYKYYDIKTPIVLMVNTDVFGTKDNEIYLNELMKEISQNKIKNPITFVTKLKPTGIINEGIDILRKTNKIIAYISYSGLDNAIEVGVNHKKTRECFEYFHDLNIPIIHYWRPLIPQNSKPEIMQEIINYVSQYATASVFGGLKVFDFMENQISDLWKELKDIIDNSQNGMEKITKYDAIFPFEPKELNKIIKLPNNYPIFKRNICALNYVLNKSDDIDSSFYKTDSCNISKCPKCLSENCKNIFNKNKKIDGIEENAIKSILDKYNINNQFKIIGKTIFFKNKLTVEETTFLKSILNCNIKFLNNKKNNNEKYWASAITGAEDIFINKIKEI